tara:strand:+ start:2104 stop:2856 length:753 start_codon:yes stop_codon:yes gene_type:complete
MSNEITLSPKDFEGKSLFITTPAYGGLVGSQFAVGISNLRLYLYAFGIKHDLFFINNDSLISRARNNCAARFMCEDYSHMIFIDADTEFEAMDVLKFLHSDKDVLVGPVPQKVLPIKYNTTVIKDESGNIITHDDKFVEVEYGGTAFMMIKREVFQKMFKSYPELKYEPYDDGGHIVPVEKYDLFRKNSYALFDTSIMGRSKSDQLPRYLAEDYMFCRRWREIGGKILLDPAVKLNHKGSYTFEGDLSKL